MTADLGRLLDRYQSGFTLERPFYVDDDVFEAEWTHLWSKGWLFVGTTAEIPNPGDFFTYDAHRDSLIIIRGKQGEVFAHYNTCRHRGSVVCLEKSGSVKALRCPYHQWVYDIDGSLLNARLMHEGFDKREYGLNSAHVRVVEGLIFVSLAKEAPSFDQIASDYAALVRPFQFDRAKVAAKSRYELRTNWKLVAENFRECYHCGIAHPEYCRAVIGANLLEDVSEVMAEQRKVWRAKGLATQTIDLTDGSSHVGVRYPLRPGVETYSLDGKAVSKPMGLHRDLDAGVLGLALFPNFWMDAVADYAWTMRVTPISASRTAIDLTWLVDGSAREGIDYDVERLCSFWKVVGEQDWALCENNFHGVEFSRYVPGPYAPSESHVAKFVDWYIEKMRAQVRPQHARISA